MRVGVENGAGGGVRDGHGHLGDVVDLLFIRSGSDLFARWVCWWGGGMQWAVGRMSDRADGRTDERAD